MTTILETSTTKNALDYCNRYSLSYEDWLDECVSDPEAYGFTYHEAYDMRLRHDLGQGRVISYEKYIEDDKKLAEWKNNRFKNLPTLASLEAEDNKKKEQQMSTCGTTTTMTVTAGTHPFTIASGAVNIGTLRSEPAYGSPAQVTADNLYDRIVRIETKIDRLISMMEPKNEAKADKMVKATEPTNAFEPKTKYVFDNTVKQSQAEAGTAQPLKLDVDAFLNSCGNSHKSTHVKAKSVKYDPQALTEDYYFGGSGDVQLGAKFIAHCRAEQAATKRTEDYERAMKVVR